MARDEERMKNSVISDCNEAKGLFRGSVTGTLPENIESLMDKLTAAGSIKRQQHLSVMISLAKFLLESGVLVATQDVVKKYKELKGLKKSSCIKSSQMLEIMAKHLNIVQIYVNGKGYIIENRGAELGKQVDSLNKIKKIDQASVNDIVKKAIGNKYNTIMQYMDSKRDRDTLNTVLTSITSATFVANELAEVQDKRSIKRSKDLTILNLDLFEKMKNSIEEEDVDPENKLTVEGKRRKRHRMLQKMKLKRLRHVVEGRGRNLKCEEFPDLAGVLEFAFGESDRVDRAGGGLESHPRLTDTVLYRAADNNTVMKQARKIILALTPEGFNICLSSCFNYTQNYKQGTYQANRHHHGKGINACLSLHKPPRTGVEQFVINLHWSTQNVNLTLDCGYLNPDNILIDSKDAKAKVSADVSPVQQPGRTWRKIELPDHDWKRLAHNSITPMTHLFMKTVLKSEEIGDEQYVDVKRTGKAVTLLNISYFEPETVHRVFNEIFLLMNNPALDSYFRNSQTGKLKEHFIFIVDNGASEAPSHPLVKMWLSRLTRVLKLKSVTQKSFAEYHSKRNPVERVHSVQNRALSNEVFKSNAIHKECRVGDEKHHENMEHMACKVEECLSNVQYGGESCIVLRGIGAEDNFIFDDEKELLTFLAKTESRKNEDENEYQPVKNKLWEDLSTVWDLNHHFVGIYREDYQILENSYDEEGELTCWCDKYSTTIFNPDYEDWDKKLFTMQPIPDYVQWFTSGGELHYLPLEKVQLLDSGIIDKTPGAYLPSTILEMVFKLFKHGIDIILPSVAFLCWCTKEDVLKFLDERKENLEKSYENEKKKEYWSQSYKYQNNEKAVLQQLCRQKGLPSEGKKHELMKSIVEAETEERPPKLENYNGELSSVPNTLSELSKLSVYKLREILRHHNILDCGVKDELVLRVGMLKGGSAHIAFHKEREALLDLINATKRLISLQKEIYLRNPRRIYKKRVFSTPSCPSLSLSRSRMNASIPHNNSKSCLNIPEGLTLESLQEILNPMEIEISLYDKVGHIGIMEDDILGNVEISALRLVGTKVLVYWSKEEIGCTGWKTG